MRSHLTAFRRGDLGTGEMAHCLKMLVLTKDPGLVSIINQHDSSNSKGSDDFSWHHPKVAGKPSSLPNPLHTHTARPCKDTAEAVCKPKRESSRETWMCQHLDLWLRPPKLWKQKCLLSRHLICGVFLWQPWEQLNQSRGGRARACRFPSQQHLPGLYQWWARSKNAKKKE